MSSAELVFQALKTRAVGSIHLEGCELSLTVAKIFLTCVSVNEKIHTINFNNNVIKPAAEWVAELAKLIESNKTLTRLALSGNNIGVSCELFFKALQKNKTLTSLDFSGNFILAEGAGFVGDCLKVNKNLASVNLSGNMIGKGVSFIADALKSNTCIK